jgi:hypothetical protein
MWKHTNLLNLVSLFRKNKFESTCMYEVYFLGMFGMKNSGPDELFIGFWVVCNI